MPIHQLFPEPVYISKLERMLTTEELKTLNKYKKKTYNNVGNTTSNDNYVLENKTLKTLKKDLNKKVINYFNKIVCSSNSILPYITQSWLNYTKPNQFHHRHSHSNSYVSGVFYINANKEVDKIKFHKVARVLELKVTHYNIFNSTSWWYAIETGDIILFPSTLVHGVEAKEGTNIRTSLAFNVFFKGTIGNNAKLTELVLE